ncbi:hypothetical protein LTR64_004909 [Lithohypha guttulata]|uniref:uncharacterized protein n=1 Tax=Lithohypha guttulata TaxID=1690604 RepID=UPI002DDF1AAE|nr:hypothetical protein LTR51_005254 [Lithohypha guttulata]
MDVTQVKNTEASSSTEEETLSQTRPEVIKPKRPSLNRNVSSFSLAVASVEPLKGIDLRKALQVVSLDPKAKEGVKEDIKLVRELRNEPIRTNIDAEALPTPKAVNKYALWECGFGTGIEPQPLSSIPDTKDDLLKALRGELMNLKFIKAGLARYLTVLNTGEHHVFPNGFLENQNASTKIAQGQLDQIKEHLEEYVTELEMIEDSNAGVRQELMELFGHAKPWIGRIRAVMIDSHLFMKLNYSLLSSAGRED